MMASTPLELALQGLPLAVQKMVQLKDVLVDGTSGLPLPGSSNEAGALLFLLFGLSKAFLLKINGIGLYAPFGVPPCTLAVVDTPHDAKPMMPAK